MTLDRWAPSQGAKQRLQQILIIAGPNGAGKTTFARSFLPREASCLRLINADLIATGLRNFEAIHKKEVDDWIKFSNMGDQPILFDLSEGGRP